MLKDSPKLFGRQPNTFEKDSKKQEANEVLIEGMYSGDLKKTGKVLMGNCPFHEESTPSFAIYPETNTWNCFAGCGGGDAISFYMKLHGVSFKEALGALTQ